MRRFNYTNRSTLFTPTIYANATAKREMGVPSAKEFNFLLRFVLFSGFTATAGLIFGAYKIGRYLEKSSAKTIEVTKETPELETAKPNLEKWDMTGFRPVGGVLWRPIDPNNPRDEHEARVVEKAKKLGR